MLVTLKLFHINNIVGSFSIVFTDLFMVSGSRNRELPGLSFFLKFLKSDI